MENKVIRPTTAKINGNRPKTGRPQTGIPKKVEKINFTDSESANKIINESQSDENQSKNSLQSFSENSNISNEKINFLEALTNGNQKQTFENIIKEEADRIDMINKQKKNLKNINLIEKNIEGLYDWKTLFNHSRPLSSYTKFNPKNIQIKKEEEKKEDKFKFPVVLVDLQENQMNMFFNDNINGNTSNKKKLMKQQLEHMQRMNKMKMNDRKSNINSNSSNISHKKSISNNNSFQRSSTRNKSIRSVRSASASASRNKKPIEGNCVRPMSVYTRRNPKDTFYFSQTFSDYYKEDLKDFVKKIPLLRAKISAKPNKLQNTLINSEKKSLLKEEKLKETIANDDLLLTKQEVIIAGKLGNAQPLLKSIYKQIHPEDEIEKNNTKMYFNTMKPLGNNNNKTDFSINDRENHLRQLVELRNGEFIDYKKRSKDDFNNFRDLKLETYDEKDPDLQIFNQIKEVNEDEYEEENNEIKENNNNIQFSKTFSSRNDMNILTTNNTTKNKNLVSSSSQQQQNLLSNNNNNTEILTTNSNLPLMNNNQQQINSNRPKTSVQPFKNNFIQKRPFSSRQIQMSHAMNQTNFHSNSLYDNFPSFPQNSNNNNENNNNLDSNYIVTKSFPLHLNSNVGNVTYNKINKRLLIKKESFENTPPQIITAEMIKNNNFSPNNIKEINKTIANRPLTSKVNRKLVSNKLNSINTGINTVNKWEIKEENVPKQKVNYYYFNDYIDTIFKDNSNAEKKRLNYIENEKGYYYPMNCFNKLAGKIYSCSSNMHVKTKRIKKNNMINTLSLEPNQDYNEELIKKRKRIYSAI